MMNVKKWAPVLKICKEIKTENQEDFAQLLENQFKITVSDPTDKQQISDFTIFTLPVVRHTLNLLWELNYNFEILEQDWGTIEWPLTDIDIAEAYRNANKEKTENDKIKVMIDSLVKNIATNIMEEFPEGVGIYHLMVPQTIETELEKLEEPVHIVMRVKVND